jgi:hypothetical protein
MLCDANIIKTIFIVRMRKIRADTGALSDINDAFIADAK